MEVSEITVFIDVNGSTHEGTTHGTPVTSRAALIDCLKEAVKHCEAYLQPFTDSDPGEFGVMVSIENVLTLTVAGKNGKRTHGNRQGLTWTDWTWRTLGKEGA